MSKRNENRLGYKKTKVGWIPEEWECVKIKDVCAQPVSGFSAKGTDNTVSPKTSDIGVLKLSCIDAGRFNPYENKQVIQADLSKVKTPICKDIMLISRSNTEELVGLVCYVEENYPNLFLSDLMWKVSAKKAETINLRWLTNLLLTKNYRKKIAARANGTSGSMKKITKGSFLRLLIPLPPFPEQKKIAEILSAWDRATEQVGKLIDAKQRLKKGLMQQLLTGRMRFQEFGTPVKEKGELPKGWRIVMLRDVASIAKKKKLTSVHGEVLLTVKLHCLGIVRNTERQPKLTEGGRPYFKRQAGEFLIGRQNFHNGGFGIIPKELDGCIASNAITSLNVQENKLSSRYLLYVFSNPNYYKRIGNIMDGTGQKELSEKQILRLKILYPSVAEQTRIAAVLSTCDREIELLKKKQEKLKEQKNGLMQKLLTGEVRHPDFINDKGISGRNISNDER
jgi:type I restriction enzyme S subunit